MSSLEEMWTHGNLFPEPRMQSCFMIDINGYHAAIADIVVFDGEHSISRINVPAPHRGKGYGRQLLREVCAEADKKQVDLWLCINASGGLIHHQLEAWYLRYGFERHLTRPGVYERKAKPCSHS